MQFGVREICDVVFKAKSAGYLNPAKKKYPYVAGQPVLYIDSAKTSTMEGAATTVYAQGGKGNARLIAWEGEKTLTFTVEDALLSEIGFAILSGAGLFNYDGTGEKAYVHNVSNATLGTDGFIDLHDALGNDNIATDTPVFVVGREHGSLDPKYITGFEPATINGKKGLQLKSNIDKPEVQTNVFVDYYIAKQKGVTELTIDAENFAGYYYVEASTLFKRQSDGKNLPAELIFPNVKIQSNFTFAMASTGDPSTFTFTMDAMPGYTRFDTKKKVLCAMQIIDEDVAGEEEAEDSVGVKADENAQYPVEGATATAIDFYSEDGFTKLLTINAKKGEKVVLPMYDNPSEEVEFKGWATTANADEADVTGPYEMGADSVILYAVYAAKAQG
jgi:hypothetical protein